ncbi:MAG: dTDP-4-dehydrorhamnose 3,5-epimerase [candidate division BRC1 bacterium ADurb.BinA292]|nr:MAG: dTDP-4-dehydrorhamnose 3,5-epimerase [candidate division BRC1 bacterium ADurb.BinA292]
MQLERTPIDGLLILRPKVFQDHRGFFLESYNERRFRELGIELPWVQDNHARSVKNTVRGLHFQRGAGQDKLLRCVRGRVWDVAVDLRPGSRTFGEWFGMELSEDNFAMLLIPAGFAHGYAVLSDVGEVIYKCSRVYDPALEDGVRWDDPRIGVQWPVAEPILSERDRTAQTLDEYLARHAGGA